MVYSPDPTQTNIPPQLPASPQIDTTVFASTKIKTIEYFIGTKWLYNKIFVNEGWQKTALKVLTLPLWFSALVVTAAFESTVGLGIYALINKFYPLKESQIQQEPDLKKPEPEDLVENRQENPSSQESHQPQNNSSEMPTTDEYEAYLKQFIPEDYQPTYQPQKIINEPQIIEEDPVLNLVNELPYIPPPPNFKPENKPPAIQITKRNALSHKQSIPLPSSLNVRLRDLESEKSWYQTPIAKKIGMIALPLIGSAAALYATGGLSLLTLGFGVLL